MGLTTFLSVRYQLPALVRQADHTVLQVGKVALALGVITLGWGVKGLENLNAAIHESFET